MLDEVQARGMHRRLKARFSPTEIFTITPDPLPTDNTSTQQDNPTTPPAANTVASSAPASTDGGAAAQSTSATPSQPTDTAAAAGAQTSSSSSATTSPTSSSTQAQATSTSSSTSSSSSSSSTSTLSSTSAPAAASNTSTATKTQVNPLGASIPLVTQTSTNTFHSASYASLGASASVSATAAASDSGSSSIQAGPIVGIVVAVIAGVVGIVFAVTYFMRRSSRNNEDDYLRRQSMVLPDEGPSPFGGPRGMNNRPTSMAEQHGNNRPISFSAQQFTDHSYYGHSNEVSFNPGEVVAMPAQAWSPVGPGTPHSGQPFFNPMGDTPMGSPISPAPYDSAYNAQGQLVRQPSAGAGASLDHRGSNGAEMMFNRQPSPGPNAAFNRQPSPGPNVAFNRQPSPAPGVALNRQPSGHSPYLTRQLPSTPAQIEPPPEAHYVDLNRSSVSPFQAAQYAEISNHLQAEPPAPLPTPMVAAAADEVFMKEDQIMPSVTTPRPLNVVNAGRVTSPVQEKGPSPFADPRGEHFGAGIHPDDLPAPPSPAYSSHSRVDSHPPKLPEIALQQRAFSPVTMDFPMSPPSHITSSPLAAPMDFPVTPSETHFADAPPTPRPAKDTPIAKRPDTSYTIYDDEDAYGGI